jgi:hypothetical protein
MTTNTKWQQRTEGARKRALLIDEVTKDWKVVNGRLQWDATSVSQVYHAIATKIQSIPTSPEYGSRLYDNWKIVASMPRELEASLLASLGPLIDANVVKEGSASIDIDVVAGNIVTVLIEWRDGGGQKQDLAIPIQPGFN